jgi:hypothetical protein
MSGICTSEMRTVTVDVVNSLGTPDSGATFVSILTRTGDTLRQHSLALLVNGTYVIVDDGSRQKIQPMGDTVNVSVIPVGGSTVTVPYLITVPNGCHVTKAAGPDTIVVQ